MNLHSRFARFVSRLLVASIALVPMMARAELIGTAELKSAAAAASLRPVVEDQFVSLGLTREAAKARVAALTDAEIAQLQAAGLEAAPAGGFSPLPYIVIALLIYFLIAKPSMEEKPAAKKSAAAPVKSAVAPVEESPRVPVAARPAPVSVPKDIDVDEELVEEELEVESDGEGEGDIEEELQGDLALTESDDDDEAADFLDKSEDLLDDTDDYRNN